MALGRGGRGGKPLPAEGVRGAVGRVFNGHKGEVRGVAVSPDGLYVVSCGDRIRLWDLSKVPGKP